ncbi:MAG: hypothetical protein ACLRWO_02965 [Clostridium butyricum]
MEYKDKLKNARKTGEGIISRFQEKANYKMAIREGYDCPHCGAYHGYKIDDSGEPIYRLDKNVSHDIYETPSNIEFMCNHTGYSWTEDCECANCGKTYSQNNGC